MKRYLLPENGQFYKANLHCHTTVSDGNWTPEEVKKNYMAEGYSVIAYTDHDVLIPHPELADENFLPLNSYEMEVNAPGPWNKFAKCCHMCLIALEPDNVTQICWHRNKYTWGNAKNIYSSQVKFDENEPDYERVYSHEGISDMMKRGRDAGFFVTYNHPAWSLETALDFTGYEHMNAMEIVNGSCVRAGFDDYNPAAYDTMLMTGKRLYCIATDDNHDLHPLGHPQNDSFRGFTMIKADKLEYRTITAALEAGNFYASQGPEITALWFEDGRVHVECKGAKAIVANYGVRKAGRVVADGELLTHASFSFAPDDNYIRITVIDESGLHANTNAYFADEVYKED